LAYSTDIESFARKAQVIFLAEDKPDHLADLAIRIARLATQASDSFHHDSGGVGTATEVEKRLKKAGLKATIVSQPVFVTPAARWKILTGLNRIILGSASNDAVLL